MPEKIKALVLSETKEILLQIKDYISDFLNLSTTHFFDYSQDDFTGINLISEVLKELNTSEEEHENALKVSDELVWAANINIQPVFDYYKALTYMCSYLPKQDDKCFRL